MPKKIPAEELQAVAAAIRKHHDDGASMTDLVGSAASEAKRRAMQRRLKKLMTAGRVRSSGTGRATRYWVADQAAQPTLLHKEEAHLDAEGGLFVPLSDASQELQKMVRRPIGERAEVGYERDFLSGYQPNVTYYLSPKEREYLAQVGTAQVGIEPAGTYARKILNRFES